MNFLTDLLSRILGGVGSIIAAALILVIAFVAAAIVKSLVLKLVDKTKLKDVLAKVDNADKPGSGRNSLASWYICWCSCCSCPASFPHWDWAV